MKNDSIFFLNKYRIPSLRLSNWDYSSPGYYFVTICTKNRICWFGEIKDNQIMLSDVGKIIEEEWKKTPEIRKCVILDEWKIMPNHIHGILIIKNNVETRRRGVSTNKWKPNSLGSILNQFKSVCTKNIWKIGYHDFCWQPRFYDSLIRDEKSLTKIKEYIMFNPIKWKEDDENPEKGKMSRRDLK